jgi:hypothetical protein
MIIIKTTCKNMELLAAGPPVGPDDGGFMKIIAVIITAASN